MMLTRALSILAVVSLVVSGGLFAMQERFLFHPEVLPEDFDYSLPKNAEEVFFDADDGARINALWYQVEEPRGVVLYFHGNAGSLRTWKSVALLIEAMRYDLFIIDYRGFGKSQGTLSEEGLYADGYGAYQALIDRGYEARDIVVLGRSIGSGVACEVAANRPVGALVLETPFANLMDLATEHIPVLPRLFLSYRFENDQKAAHVDAPVLILHGDRDEVVPLDHGKQLFEAFSTPREFALLEGARHNDITEHRDYLKTLDGFLEQYHDSSGHGGQ